MPTTWPGSWRSSSRARPAEALLDSYEDERIPVARRLLNTTDRAFRLVVSDNWLAGLFRTQDTRQDRGVRDEPRSGSRRWRFAPSRRPASTTARARCRNRCDGLPAGAPQRGRPLPVAAAQAAAGRPGRGPVPETRRHAIQSDRDRAACASRRSSRTSATCCASMRFPPIPSMTRNWRARRFPSPRSISCVPTAMSGFAERQLDPAALKRYVSENLHLAV